MSKQRQKAAIEPGDEVPIYKPSAVKALNIVAAVLALILIIVIYIPSLIWREEASVRRECRRRMTILNQVEKFYHRMTEKYQTDPLLAMKLVSAARDSTRADSNFAGDQQIKLDEGVFNLKVPKNFYTNFDTAFAFSYKKRDTIIDTTYMVTKWNRELYTYDTLYILSSRWREIRSDSSYRAVLDTELSERIMENTYFRRYYLKPKLAHCPLINDLYIVTTDSDGYRIDDPLDYEYREPRYLVFAFKDSSHGYIENDKKSWQ